MASNKQQMFVGEVFSTNNYGQVEILGYQNCENVTVRFLNTGAVRTTCAEQIKKGLLRDKTLRAFGVQIGDEFVTNNSGKCIVVDYEHAKKILVRFEDNGVLKWTNSSQLKTGTASSRAECERVEVGQVFHSSDGFAATVAEVLKESRFKVLFEDGTTKDIKIGYLRAGTFLKGSLNYTQEEAIEAMKSAHGGFYDYSLVEFKNVKGKIKVKCPKHGVFQTSFDNHVNAANGGVPSGCRKCGIEKRAAKKTLDSSLFVEAAKQIHGERYTYALADYKNRNTKIKMICSICDGTFMQSPEKHLTGQGCSFCNKSGFDPAKDGVLYVLANVGMTKIGITNKSASHRTQEINRTITNKFSVVREYLMSGVECAHLERTFLSILRKEYESPDFKFDGYTECFLGLDSGELVEMLDCVT